MISLDQQLSKLVRAPDSVFDMGECALIVAQHEYPDLDIQAYLQRLDQIGGPSYLAELLEQAPSSVNIKSHAKIIKEKALLRQIILTGQNFAEKAYSQDFSDVEVFLNEFEASAFKISENHTSCGASHFFTAFSVHIFPAVCKRTR